MRRRHVEELAAWVRDAADVDDPADRRAIGHVRALLELRRVVEMSRSYHREEPRLHLMAPWPYVTACGSGKKRFVARTSEEKKVDCMRCRALIRKYGALSESARVRS